MEYRSARVQRARIVAVIVSGLLASPATAANQRTTDMWSSQAGFIMKRADTPAHVTQMMAMPPRRFIARTSPSGKRYFLYADPGDCKCVFVGDETARQNYRSIASAGLPKVDNVAPGGTSQEQLVEGMDRDMDGDIDGAPPSGIDLFSYPF